MERRSVMADYAFTTLWQIPAPVAPIWTAITEVERWPQWSSPSVCPC